MHYLGLDTNTWIYLANGTEPVKLLHYIKQEVERGNITLLLPEIIITEWNRNKENAVKQGVLKHYKDIKESLERILKLLGEKGERDVFSFLLPNEDEKDYFKDFIEKFKAKKKEIEEAITSNIKLIDELFEHKNATVINIIPEVYVKAGQYAIEKKAPFKNKNNFADALIAFSFIHFVEASSIEDALFITYNTDDFCEKREGKKYLHPDLKPDFVRSKSRFFTIVGEALNTLKEDLVTAEELDLIRQYQEEASREDEIEYCDGCFDNGYHNPVYFREQELIDERPIRNADVPNQLQFEFAIDLPKQPAGNRYDKIEVGNCSWCNLEHFKCVECGEINTVCEGEYNEKKECQSCGITYYIDHFMDSDYSEECVYKILAHMDICQKCGEDFEPDGSATNICSRCEAKYSYS